MHNDRICWLEHADGHLSQIDLSQVVSFGKTGRDYRETTPRDLRANLLQEFGPGYDVQVRGKYVVLAPAGRAKAYADLFDAVSREYWAFFSRRGFGLTQPRHPLVAVVFPNRDEFVRYCLRDHVPPTKTLKGYYHPLTNRVAIYEQVPGMTAVPSLRPDDRFPGPGAKEDFFTLRDPKTSYSTTTGPTEATIIHEATHQLAFNTGLHSRIAQTPHWVVEGLAMLFEAQMNPSAPAGPRGGRINVERRQRFAEFAPRRAHTIELLITNEEQAFQVSVLDAYAEAWALSYFLSETRAEKYGAYLKSIAARDPLVDYAPQQRLQDFQAAFGNDLKWLEIDFVRYLDGLP